MSVETQITFRGIEPFDHARDVVHARLARIAPLLPRRTRCVVLLERVVDAQQIGNRRIHARVQLRGTGLQVLTVGRADDGPEALRAALARAEERLRRQRGSRYAPAQRASVAQCAGASSPTLMPLRQAFGHSGWV